ncbi:MAG: O-antigen ligase family protein [Coriobacteriia bacterium]
MNASHRHGQPRSWGVPAALLALAFMAPGAWLVGSLPPVPVAQAFNVASAGAWLVACGLGAVTLTALDRRLATALGALGAAVLVSYLLGGSLLEVAFYDLFGNMPLVGWLAYPAVFIAAAGAAWDRRGLERAVEVIVGVGAVLASVMALQQLTAETVRVFGSPAYAVTALVPLVPLAAWRAASRTGMAAAAWYAAGGVIAAALAFASGSLMGAVATAFSVLASIAIHPAPAAAARAWPVVRKVAAMLAATLVTALLFVQVPAVSGTLAGPDAVVRLGKNVVARAYLWEGAQAMVADRPLFGFGPSGYRVAAAEYLDPRALQFEPDVAGNIDPTVYSPQSPHSVLWEITTRLGLVGLGAFISLFVVWLLLVRDRAASEDPAAPRRALAVAFASALVSLLVNPAVFAIGLFAPVAAGLAVAQHREQARLRAANPGAVLLTTAGAILVAAAVWAGVGEVRLASSAGADVGAAITRYEQALRIVPGHPVAERSLLELRLYSAEDTASVGAVQRDVDDARPAVTSFRPNMVSLAAFSLAQAERTGRTDVTWEIGMLDQAAERLPPIPSLVAERLHAAVVAGDRGAVREALPDAERWGGPYPLTERYLTEAQALLGP